MPCMAVHQLRTSTGPCVPFRSCPALHLPPAPAIWHPFTPPTCPASAPCSCTPASLFTPALPCLRPKPTRRSALSGAPPLAHRPLPRPASAIQPCTPTLPCLRHLAPCPALPTPQTPPALPSSSLPRCRWAVTGTPQPMAPHPADAFLPCPPLPTHPLPALTCPAPPHAHAPLPCHAFLPVLPFPLPPLPLSPPAPMQVGAVGYAAAEPRDGAVLPDPLSQVGAGWVGGGGLLQVPGVC